MDRTSLLRVCVANTGVQDRYLSPCVCKDGIAHFDKMVEESVAQGVLNADGTLKADNPAVKEEKVKEEKTTKARKRKADEEAVEE